MKKIALLYCGLNFEKQRESIKELHKEIKRKGDACYVMTCYDSSGSSAIPEGDQAVYTLANHLDCDGYVIDEVINGDFVEKYFFESGRLVGKPVVNLNRDSELAPSVQLDSYDISFELLEHLILVHNCRKINIVADFTWYREHFNEYLAFKAYNDVLLKYGIPVEKKRFVDITVGIPQAYKAWDMTKEQGADDCDAIFTINDVMAIGLASCLVKEGKRVPEDIKLATVRRSGNSVAFKPDITGGVDNNGAEARAIKSLLYEQLEGNMMRPIKKYSYKAVFGESCGCTDSLRTVDKEKCREIVLNKINSGSQIQAMMVFNDSIEKVESLEEYTEIIKKMYDSLGFTDYAVMLNKRDIAYILDAENNVEYDPENPFDDTMFVLAGKAYERDLTGEEISLEKITPFDVRPGDIVTLMPITHKNRSFGYIAILNSYITLEMYNYRICHDSLGNSIENLRRQMALKHSINEMNELRMRDPLTGYYNRASIKSFKDSIEKLEEFTIVMMDMDGLKKINDNYGHEEGNRAIKLMADCINRALHTGEILARYGGDEFVVMSPTDTTDYWLEQRDKVNEAIQKKRAEENIEYNLGVSIGFFAHTKENPVPIDECFEKADECMYENKVLRKAQRTD